ncbi:NAD(P)-binding protein [Legionella sp. CNM-1927-20]|uniref:NAD(P)-binding protein n=1 Tax=Legionella sp. CNM-1927-20 TaxID=3422221 RepID=UPI00403B08E1
MTKSKQESSCDYLIVGMGPLGLAAAYELARKNHTVRIIDKRSEEDVAVRPQPLLITPSVKRQLLEMIRDDEQLNDKDLKFIDNLLVSSEVKISSIQKFILRRIESLNSYQNKDDLPRIILYFSTELEHVNLEIGTATYKKKSNASTSHQITMQNATVEYSQILTVLDDEVSIPHSIVAQEDNVETSRPSTTYDAEIDTHQIIIDQEDEVKNLQILATRDNEADIAQSSLKEEEPQFFHFKHLIAADGASAPTLELVRKNSNVKIERKTPSNKQYVASQYHFGAYLTIKSKHPFALPERDHLTIFLDGKLCLIRLYHKSHLINNKTSVKLGFVGQIPSLIYNEPNETERRTKAIAYAKIAIAQRLKLSAHELDIEITQSQKYKGSKERVKLLFFQGQSLQATRAFENQGGHYFCLLGDAYFTPHYPVGHGFNDGMESVNLLAKMPKDSTELVNFMISYQKLAEENAKEAQTQMAFLRYVSPLPFIGSKLLPEYLENSVAKRDDENKINITSINKSKHINVPVQAIEKIFAEIMLSFSLIYKGSPRYGIAFISANNLTEPVRITLTDLSTINGGIPFIIVDQRENKEIKIQSFTKKGAQNYSLKEEYSIDFFQNIYQKQLKDTPIIQDSLEELSIVKDSLDTEATAKQPLEEIFTTQGHIIIYLEEDCADYPIPDHYQSLSNNVIENIKSKFVAMQSFVKQYPNIVVQYSEQIINGFVKTKELLIKYPDLVTLYGEEVFHEMRKATTSFLFTILQSEIPFDRANMQYFLKAAIVLDIPEVIPLLILRGASPFVPLSPTNKTLLFNLLNLQPQEAGYLAIYANQAITLEFLMLMADPSSELNKAAVKNLSLNLIEKLITQITNEEIFDNLSSENLLSLATRYQLDMNDAKKSIRSHLVKYLIDDLRPKLISDQIKSSAQAKNKGSSLTFMSGFSESDLQTETSRFYKLKELLDATYSSIQHKAPLTCKNICAQLLNFLLSSRDNLQESDTKLDDQAIKLLNEPRFKDYRETILKNLSKQLSQHIQESHQSLDDLINIYYLCQKLNLLNKNYKPGLFDTASKNFSNNFIAIRQYINRLVNQDKLASGFYTNAQEEAINEILSSSPYHPGKTSLDDLSKSEFRYL